MSIKDLKMYRNEYNGEKELWRCVISDFMDEVIITFQDQSDEIASLRQQLAQNPDYLYVPRMEGTDGVDNIR